ncbi:MAG: ankyrin repeat domain-containing protein [Candidatus Dependentiae bacterium]|nr:ankyrin repeat domain-containing protein [Candidatus Dependentiae bacterium]
MEINKVSIISVIAFFLCGVMPLFAMQGDPAGSTDIFEASFSGNIDSVRYWLDAGVDVNAKEALSGDTALMKAIRMSQVNKAELLLSRGADVNAQNLNRETPLMLAAMNSNVEMVVLLLAWGADIKAKNNKGDTVLICAMRWNDDVEKVRLLLGHSAGIDINAKNNDGDTALLVFANQSYHRDFNAGYELLNNGADINAVNKKGQSVLMLLVPQRNTLSIIDVLITKWKANPYQKDHSGLNAFDYARGNQAIIDILKKTQFKQEQVEKYESVLPKAVRRMEHIRRAMDQEKGPWINQQRNGGEGEEEKKEAAEEKEEAAGFLTPTEAHYKKYKETIDRLYGREVDNKGVLDIKIVKECLKRERKAYKEGKYVFYRAEPGQLRVYEYFIQELHKIIRLYSKQAPFVFTRFFKDAAAQETINEYVDSVGSIYGRGKHPSMLLSANIPLFGNVNLLTSCTWDYFIQNKSIEQIDMQELFKRIFDMYDFDPRYQEKLVKIAQSIQETTMASLQQIIVPKEVVDNVAMLAQVGYCVPWNQMIDKSCWDPKKSRHTKISPLLDKYKEPGFVINDAWQVRLLMNSVYGLNPDSGIEFHVYTNTPEDMLVKTQNQISEITDQLFTEWLTRQLNNKKQGQEVPEYLQQESLGTVLGHIGKGKKGQLADQQAVVSQQEQKQEQQQELEQEAAQEAPARIKPWLKDKPLDPIETSKPGLRRIFQSYKPASIWAEYALLSEQKKSVTKASQEMQDLFMQDCDRDQKQNGYIPEKDRSIARVATYNVHKWRNPKNKRNYKGILDTIKAINADVLVLQEVVFPDGNTCAADFKELGYEYQVSKDTGNTLHNMIVSKYPFIQEPIKKVYTVDQDSRDLEKRNFINTRVQLPDGNTLSVYGTHLDVRDASGKKREEEVKELLAAAGADESKNILLAADWNAERKKDYQYTFRSQAKPQSAAAAVDDKLVWDLLGANFKVRNPELGAIPTGALDAIETKGFQDSFTRAKVPVNPTYTVWTGTVVDFIFCAPTWQLPVDGSYVYYSSASDHVPVMMDIELNQSGAAAQAAAAEEAAESKEAAAAQ